jgi:hypothetical protein
MIPVQRVDIDALQLGAVLLVDTEDACLKLIVDYDIGTIDGRCVHISDIKEGEELAVEEDRGTFMVSNIIVGEPIDGVVYPRQRNDGVVEVGGMLKTTPVKVIEVYQDEEPA